MRGLTNVWGMPGWKRTFFDQLKGRMFLCCGDPTARLQLRAQSSGIYSPLSVMKPSAWRLPARSGSFKPLFCALDPLCLDFFRRFSVFCTDRSVNLQLRLDARGAHHNRAVVLQQRPEHIEPGSENPHPVINAYTATQIPQRLAIYRTISLPRNKFKTDVLFRLLSFFVSSTPRF